MYRASVLDLSPRNLLPECTTILRQFVEGGKRQGRCSKEETEKTPMPTELCFAIKMRHHALHPQS